MISRNGYGKGYPLHLQVMFLRELIVAHLEADGTYVRGAGDKDVWKDGTYSMTSYRS